MKISEFKKWTITHWRMILLILSILLAFITFFMILLEVNATTIRTYTFISITAFGTVMFEGFYRFLTNGSRDRHEITRDHGQLSLSAFYSIYFPVVMFSFLVQLILIIFQFSLISISPFLNIIYIIPSLITSLGIIAISDHEMREKSLTYSPPGHNKSYVKSVLYGLPLVGFYFGFRLTFGFVLKSIFGNTALYTSEGNPFSIDSNAIYVAKTWRLLSNLEKALLPFTFILAYVAVEIFMRGYITNLIRSLKLGPSAIIFIPAVIQAAAFSSGILLISNPVFYLFRFIDAMVFSLVVGIVLWRTKSFGVSLTIAMIMRFLDTSSEFFRVIMLSMPKIFGEYDLYDGIASTTEKIATSFVFTQFFLISLSPLILIISYEEVGNIIKGIWINFKNQWFGYIIIAFAFIIIDLVFSFLIGGGNPLGAIGGFIIALIVIRYVLKFVFSALPKTTNAAPMENQRGILQGEYPLNILKDLDWLDNKVAWHNYSKQIAFVASFIFVYFLFIAAVYRQYSLLSTIDTIKFTLFLIILPTVLFGISTYLLVDRYNKGYFFSENWRNQLFFGLSVLYVYNVLIWTISGAIASFAWRNVPFFIFYALLLFPKKLEQPKRDFAYGLSRGGRYATFKWVINDSSDFEEVYKDLINVESETISSGAHLLAAKLGIINEHDNINRLRVEIPKGEIIGRILALGILESKSAEGLLLNYLSNDDIDIKMVAYWSLGIVGSTRVLSKMAQVIEENPKKDLVKIAEKAILRIDPMYPLAGLRDQVMLT